MPSADPTMVSLTPRRLAVSSRLDDDIRFPALSNARPGTNADANPRILPAITTAAVEVPELALDLVSAAYRTRSTPR